MIEKLKTAVTQLPALQQLHARYEQLSSRDQTILLILAGFILVVTFYVLAWSPLNQWSDSQMDDYGQQLETKAWLQTHIGKAREIENRKKSGATQRDLPSVVSHVAKQAGITISRIQPDKKGLAVWLEDAAYQKVLGWLVALETNHYVVVRQIKLERLKEEGRIKSFIHLGASL